MIDKKWIHHELPPSVLPLERSRLQFFAKAIGETDPVYADLAAAAHLSAIDYLGDVPWSEDDAAKAWYARVKSRPSFRPLLSDWLAGVPASRTYVDLDF